MKIQRSAKLYRRGGNQKAKDSKAEDHRFSARESWRKRTGYYEYRYLILGIVGLLLMGFGIGWYVYNTLSYAGQSLENEGK